MTHVDWPELQRVATHEVGHQVVAQALGCRSIAVHVGLRAGRVDIQDPPADPVARAAIGLAGAAAELILANPAADPADLVRLAASADERFSAPDRALCDGVVIDVALAAHVLEILRRRWGAVRAEARAATLRAVEEAHRPAPAARRPGVVYLGD